jgi:hypothetical protein
VGDLDGEGISGVLLANDRGWYHKANPASRPRATRAAPLPLPVPTALGAGVQQLAEISTGWAQLGSAQYSAADPPLAHADVYNWTSFAAFQALPRSTGAIQNLRFLDVDGGRSG